MTIAGNTGDADSRGAYSGLVYLEGNEANSFGLLFKPLFGDDYLRFEVEGKRFDTGDKLGFLKATVEFALARPDLSDEFRAYLKGLNI